MTTKPKTFAERAALFADPEAAREFIEQLRWNGNPVCPHCGGEEPYKLTPKPDSKRPVRPGVYKCRECRKQFTVTVGTIFEGSKVKLNKWLYAIHLMCSSKKGISANQLKRELEVTYKTAWFMCHRIREAMKKEPLSSMLTGEVEVDETYVGGKKKKGTPGRGTVGKAPVFTMLQRDGEARSFLVGETTGKALTPMIRANVEGTARVMTDTYGAYYHLHKDFPNHQQVDHSKEYVRGNVHTNFAESFFSLLKRGILGTFHHVSRQHLQRYCEEFDFRWNSRDLSDWERTRLAIEGAEGKRLYYKDTAGAEA